MLGPQLNTACCSMVRFYPGFKVTVENRHFALWKNPQILLEIENAGAEIFVAKSFLVSYR